MLKAVINMMFVLIFGGRGGARSWRPSPHAPPRMRACARPAGCSGQSLAAPCPCTHTPAAPARLCTPARWPHRSQPTPHPTPGARLPQGHGRAHPPGRLQGHQVAEEDQEGAQAPLLDGDLPGWVGAGVGVWVGGGGAPAGDDLARQESTPPHAWPSPAPRLPLPHTSPNSPHTHTLQAPSSST